MDKNKQYPAEVFTWMITVAQMPALYYGTIPMKDLYKVFQSGKDMIPGHDGAPGAAEIGEHEFGDLLRGFIAMRNMPGVAGTRNRCLTVRPARALHIVGRRRPPGKP